MSFGLRRNTRIREETLHNATEDGRYKAKQLQQERKMKEYEETIEKLEKKISTLETQKQLQHDQLQVQEKRHEEALYQSAVTNRENHVQFEKFQKLAIEKQQVEEQSKHLDSDVKSLQESSNILRAAHERLFTDYKLVGEKCKKLEEENMKLKDENEDLNRSVVNLKVYKEKFVATNKEIVKIYRDKQNIVNEKFQLKNVSEKMEKGYLMAIDELNERLKHTLDTIRVLKRKYDVTHSEYKANRELFDKQKEMILQAKNENRQLEINANLQKVKNEENVKKIENMSASLTMYADEVAKTMNSKDANFKKMMQDMQSKYQKKIQKLSTSSKLQKHILEERARDDVIKVIDQQEVVSSQLMDQIKRLANQINILKFKNRELLDENRKMHLKFTRQNGFKKQRELINTAASRSGATKSSIFIQQPSSTIASNRLSNIIRDPNKKSFMKDDMKLSSSMLKSKVANRLLRSSTTNNNFSSSMYNNNNRETIARRRLASSSLIPTQ